MNVDDCVGKEIRQLQISESETDLSKFIAVTQSFATNEAKMREVAGMQVVRRLLRAFARKIAAVAQDLTLCINTAAF